MSPIQPVQSVTPLSVCTRGPCNIGREQFGRRGIGRVQLAAVAIVLRQVPQSRFERLLRSGVIAGEQRSVSLAQIGRIGPRIAIRRNAAQAPPSV